MKALFLTFSLFIFITSSAQELPVNLSYQEIDNGYQIIADNEMYCPVSVAIEFDLVNMKSSNGNNKVFLVPARSKAFVLTELRSINSKQGYKFSYQSKLNFGNHLQTAYDKNFEYYLPFDTGTEQLIGQGYNGSFSHHNQHALDFNCELNTPIYAARGGIVVKLVQHNTVNCPKKKCAEFNNYIMIYHDDGTFASYTHIRQSGARASIGDTIEQGQLIAMSGNVGWSAGPHLHFEVFLQRLDEKENFKTKFLVGDGTNSQYLEESKIYRRDY